MPKKAKGWTHPVKDYKYRSGNDGRHHPGLVHYGYAQRPPPGYSYVKHDDDEPKAAAA